MSDTDPSWVAPLTGHDWRDEDVLRATSWFRSFVSESNMERRLEAARDQFVGAWHRRLNGDSVPLYDVSDVIAWYIFQAETYAVDRTYWFPEATAQIVPLMTRLGKELETLRSIQGIEERAARVMTSSRRQPEGPLFEMIVALAYKRRGWSTVAFVPEQRGGFRTPDLIVTQPRRKWAVECKRLGQSTYETNEKARGEALARPVHELSLAANRAIVMEVNFHLELTAVADDHLADRVNAFFNDPRESLWLCDESSGHVRDIDWSLSRNVLSRDFVYYGSSRMIELLVGHYDHQANHSMDAKWRPSQERPFYADAVYHASVVSWHSRSRTAIGRKAGHFRSTIARANSQLPSNMPGVIHIGVETWSGPRVDSTRHILNMLESRYFRRENSRLRWVYGNYIAPEVTTRSNESWAMNETMVPYKVGRHSTAEPLPGHLLISPDTESNPGVHWNR